MMESSHDVKYAGFWVRSLAAMIDGIVLYLPLAVITMPFKYDGSIFIILALLLWWFYTSKMISSSWQATIGKKIVDIKVLTESHEQLTFKQASLRYVYSFLSYIFILPIFMMFFNQKKQTLHDYINKNIVLDSYKTKIYHAEKENIEKPKKTVRYVRSILIVTFTLIQAYILYMVLSVISWYFLMATNNQKSYDNSFKIEYHPKDYNNSKILFYKQELEKSSKNFMEAEGMYDIFESGVKKDLALECIEYYIKSEGRDSWIDEVNTHRRAARNKYANTDEKIEKVKNNIDYMYNKRFYDYDINDVNTIKSIVINTNKDESLCDNLITTSILFDDFMVRYIPKREAYLRSYKQSYITAKPKGTPSKSFYEKKIESSTLWLKTLHTKYPNIVQMIREFKREQKSKQIKEAQIIREKKRKKAFQRKIELTWLASEKDNLYTLGYYRNLDLNFQNEKGQTPLMIAVKNGYIKVIEQFSKGKIDVSVKDNEGKTAFDYIKGGITKEERIKSDKLYKVLQLLEGKQKKSL